MLDLMTLPKIISIKHIPHKVWGPDAGRVSNSGHFSGTFVGFNDEIEISFGHTNQTELTIIQNALKGPIVEQVKFVDHETGINLIEDFYSEDITIERDNLHTYLPFTVNLVAIDPRR